MAAIPDPSAWDTVGRIVADQLDEHRLVGLGSLSAELPRLSPADALSLLLLYRDHDCRRFERGVVRWHALLCLEVRILSPGEAQLAADELVTLCTAPPWPPLPRFATRVWSREGSLLAMRPLATVAS